MPACYRPVKARSLRSKRRSRAEGFQSARPEVLRAVGAGREVPKRPLPEEAGRQSRRPATAGAVHLPARRRQAMARVLESAKELRRERCGPRRCPASAALHPYGGNAAIARERVAVFPPEAATSPARF